MGEGVSLVIEFGSIGYLNYYDGMIGRSVIIPATPVMIFKTAPVTPLLLLLLVPMITSRLLVVTPLEVHMPTTQPGTLLMVMIKPYLRLALQ